MLEAEVDAKTKEIDEALAKLRDTVASTSTTSTEEIEAHATTFEAKLVEFETTISTQQSAIAAARERQSEAFTEA